MTLFILCLLSFTLTGLVRHYALMRKVMDIPNYRSSHTIPTPRGGGVAFVVLFLVSLIVTFYSNALSLWDALGFFVSGASVALLGFMDDHHPIAAKWRLLVHFIASAFLLYCLGGIGSLLPSSAHVPVIMLVLNILALFYLVWMLNLYNFMDGINGLAAMEAITVCLGGALIYGLYGYHVLMTLPLILATTIAGFLVWNFPVARIFMGDVGSGFLGLMIAAFSIQASQVQPIFFWSWLILSGVFIVDATFTLLFRMYNGRRLDEPHREHAYQRAVDMLGSHVTITLSVLLINLLWLFPLALLVANAYLNGLLGVGIAYTPLIFMVYFFKTKSTGNQ